jgi:glucosamine-6-phosphate deaminase
MRSAFDNVELPRRAVTIGIGTILEARRILVLVSGRAKRDALRAMLHGPISPTCPASALRLHPDVTVIASNETFE